MGAAADVSLVWVTNEDKDKSPSQDPFSLFLEH